MGDQRRCGGKLWISWYKIKDCEILVKDYFQCLLLIPLLHHLLLVETKLEGVGLKDYDDKVSFAWVTRHSRPEVVLRDMINIKIQSMCRQNSFTRKEKSGSMVW